MPSTLPFGLLADAVLVLHFSFIFFVVGGLAFVVVGNLRGWQWVNGLWFRTAHLGAIGFVVAESWLEMPCPLTTLEGWLRPRDGSTSDSQGFIEHWLHRAFAYEIPPWMFSTTDAGIGLLTLLAWWYFPPRRGRETSQIGGEPFVAGILRPSAILRVQWRPTLRASRRLVWPLSP